MPYYAIFDFESGQLSVHHLVDGLYQPLPANERGHYVIQPMKLELGVWHGTFGNGEADWLRWFDLQGNLLPTGSERADMERNVREEAQRLADQARQDADEERRRAEEDRLAREQAQQCADKEKQRAEQEKKRAEQEKKRADDLAARLRALGVDPENP